MVIMAPSDENECRQMLYTGFMHHGPAAVRYPRGGGSGGAIQTNMQAIPIGEAEIKRLSTLASAKDEKIAILSFGSMLTPSLKAGEALNATVVNMRFVKPLDQKMLEKLAIDHTLIVTVEENAIMGGAGAAVLEALQALKKPIRSLSLGLPDLFIEHGVHETMLAECGLDAEGIVKSITKALAD